MKSTHQRRPLSVHYYGLKRPFTNTEWDMTFELMKKGLKLDAVANNLEAQLVRIAYLQGQTDQLNKVLEQGGQHIWKLERAIDEINKLQKSNVQADLFFLELKQILAKLEKYG